MKQASNLEWPHKPHRPVRLWSHAYGVLDNTRFMHSQSSGGSRRLLKGCLRVYLVSLRKHNYVHYGPHWRYTETVALQVLATSEMTCCRCNRSGRCRNCSCVKSGTPCQGCLPQRLGNCTNASVPTSNQEQQPPVVEQTSLQCSEGMNTLETQVHLEEEDSHTSITSDPSTSVTDNSPDGPTVIWPLPTMEEPNFIWGNIQGEEFCAEVNQAY